MSEPMKREGLVYGMPEAEYHSGGGAELSSTGASLLLKSAKRYKYEVIDGNRKHSDAFDLGTIVHTKVLGAGADFIEYPDEFITASGMPSKSKAALEWTAEQHAAGLVLLSPAQADAANQMVESVLGEPESRRLFEREGDSEVSMFDEVTGVRRRGRIDYLPKDGGLFVDLKTSRDASKFGFRNSVESFGYYIQYGHYTDMLERITGEKRDMFFVVVENVAPFDVNVIRFDENEDYAHFGQTEALAAVDRYRKCMETGIWPGHLENGITKIKPSMRLTYDFQEKYESGDMQL